MRSLKLALVAALLAGCVFVADLYLFAVRPLDLRSSPLDFEIPAGLSLRAVTRVIAESGVAMPSWKLSLLGRVLGKAAGIKAGSYEIEAGVTPLQLLDKLTRGDVTQSELLLVEGKTFRQLREALDANPDFRHDTAGLSDAQILQRLGIDAPHPEGLFAPDTYLFSKGSSDLDVLRRAHRALEQRLAAEWDKRAPDVPYRSPYEALIMASIIEKETGVAADRPQIASVFVNRLRSGIPLQTDPSVIYGLGKGFDGNLRRQDLVTDSPYNTYVRAGLPPTPISMPGLAALQAALHPPASDKFYFVSRGDGSSEFSRTLDEHNRAVARYQLHRGSK